MNIINMGLIGIEPFATMFGFKPKQEMTWTCHICRKNRPDSKIDVASFPMKGLKGAEINIRYCNDNTECENKAWESGKKGEFPL